ncbi:glucose-6-phosphate isomerase [Leucobacter allii]|uniref:Glucose-6-phosphate isomerase n=1 Tax=Leucobacter allii TaxID=2932247 RepID=A0ABY4FQE9_9MICO|nr:glucose-6-phosphate isomerase [Leucobacter allii]UOQ58498.1 glucose-6-phosphate isomerase [Leucobacter allii]
MTIRLDAGMPERAIAETVAELVEARVASRIFARDAGLWGAEAAAEAAIRLGWTDVSPAAERLIPEIEALRAEFAASGVDRVVLCGMGGSSLAPEVIARWHGVPLEVLDSTHPAVVRRAVAGDLSRTVVVVSSKSGGTIETLSQRAAFERAFAAAGIDPAGRIVVVTDPGSALEADARARGQRVFLADPEVGGRFSALTAFGLVPAGLAGAELRALLAEADSVRAELAADDASNPALRLAAAIGEGLPGRFLLAVRASHGADAGLGQWIEQLVAESTGKDGVGVLPIALAETAPEFVRTPAQALPIAVGPERSEDGAGPGSEGILLDAPLGAQFLLWEVATSVLGRLIGIDPFDQPDVEAAKVAARAALAAPARDAAVEAAPIAELADAVVQAAPGAAPRSASGLVDALRAVVPATGYLAIQAYLDASATRTELEALRAGLAASLGVPVALGFGPGYLHSTGQLHKGGPAAGAFLQLSDTGAGELGIPDGEAGFGALIAAQARGDRGVLAERGRPVIALGCPDPAETVRRIITAI